jgi:hypothetical protein
MRVTFTTDYTPGVYGTDVDTAHKLVMAIVGLAILEVGHTNFRPGMPGYGQALHDALSAQIKLLNHPGLSANPVYFKSFRLPDGESIPAGASVPDIVYAPGGVVLAAWELKTGRAAKTLDADIAAQRAKTLENLPAGVPYSYILVTEN